MRNLFYILNYFTVVLYEFFDINIFLITEKIVELISAKNFDKLS